MARCFMVERCNERDGTTMDVRRVDTGEILLAGVTWVTETDPEGRRLPVGAMWWWDIEEGRAPRPSGPDDWPPDISVTWDEWDRMRAAGDRAGLDRVQLIREAADTPRKPTWLFAPGPQLCVMTPGGVWEITSRATNCTMPYDYEHRCWVVHGEPPDITVDKNGVTCAAGGGSIQCGSYHGFLTAGELTGC